MVLRIRITGQCYLFVRAFTTTPKSGLEAVAEEE